MQLSNTLSNLHQTLEINVSVLDQACIISRQIGSVVVELMGLIIKRQFHS